MKTTHLILVLFALLILGGGAYWLTQTDSSTVVENELNPTDTMPVEPDGGIGDGAEPLEEPDDQAEDDAPYSNTVEIGNSVEGRPIVAHTFGTGNDHVVFMSGLHGGDAPNTSALGAELIEYFTANESAVPESLQVTVIPTLNPDGLAGDSRFNANGVDLNRNFGCEWAATSMWRDQEVSGGSAPYSEPEAAAVRNYLEEINAVGAVVWFAAEGKVYPSACEGVPSEESVTLAATFANAADYPVDAEFDAYQINGDITNWLADEGVPAISVLLTDRENTELARNLAGVDAVLQALAAE